MKQFDDIRQLMSALGYSEPTPLQESAFSETAIYRRNQNAFIIGETSSGKTLIPFLLYFKEYLDAVKKGIEKPKMIFAVPYRALAKQKEREFKAWFQKKNINPQIAVSTGEISNDDARIIAGEVDVAVIITEKIFRFMCISENTLSHYNFFVLDEVGIINNQGRGGKVDFIVALTYLHQQTRNTKQCDFRTIALGTPFYNWDNYIKNYQFLKIQNKDRPVRLEYTTIEYKTKQLLSIQPESSSFRGWLNQNESCLPLDIPSENMETVASICAKICRWHIQQNHQVLIFLNDRARVRLFAEKLFLELADCLYPSGKLMSIEKCKKLILAALKVHEDDLWGLLEDRNYQAILYGVAFHSAALPLQLRELVESMFLSNNTRYIRDALGIDQVDALFDQDEEYRTNKNLLSELYTTYQANGVKTPQMIKVVCSTETLAFGINSNVDAVIIPDIIKQEHGQSRKLTPNEYQNYAGRAGRLNPNISREAQKGYVYTFLKNYGEGDVRTTINRDWAAEQEKTKTVPNALYSLLFSDFDRHQGSMIPFFLLSILPLSGSMTEQELIDILLTLPRNELTTPPEMVRDFCLRAIEDLLKHRLILVRIEEDFGEIKKSFLITKKGALLRGRIIGINDYALLNRALDKAVAKDARGKYHLNYLCFLMHLIDVHYLDKDIQTVYRRSNRAEVKEKKLFTSFSDSERTMLKSHYRNSYLKVTKTTDFKTKDYKIKDNIFTMQFIHARQMTLAAIWDWSHSERVRNIFNRYHIAYPLLQRIAQQACYLVEICVDMLDEKYVGLDTEQLQSLHQEFHNFWMSLFYGIDIRIYNIILQEIKPKDSGEFEGGQYENWKIICERNERVIRNAAKIYRFFEKIKQEGRQAEAQLSDEEFEKLRNSYRNEIMGIGNVLYNVFVTRFGAVFDR